MMGRAVASTSQHGLGEARNRDKLSMGGSQSAQALGDIDPAVLGDGSGLGCGPRRGASAAHCTALDVSSPTPDGTATAAETGTTASTWVSGPAADGPAAAETGTTASTWVSGPAADGPAAAETGTTACAWVSGPAADGPTAAETGSST